MTAVTEATAPYRERGPVVTFLIRLFRDKPLGAAGAVIFLVFLFCGVFADVLAPYGLNQISPINRLKPPSLQFPFGTDNLGRDMFFAHPLRRPALGHHRLLRGGACER